MTSNVLKSVAVLAAVVGVGCDSNRRPEIVDSSAGRLDSLPPVRNVALVRMVNAVPSLDNVSVSSQDVSVFSDIDYKDVTEYREIEQILARFRLLAGKRDTTLSTNIEILLDGSRYTLIALPANDGGVRLRVLRDELTPDSGMARLRVIHAAPGVDAVDVAIEGQDSVLFDDINFGLEAGFRDVGPVQAPLVVRAADGGRQLLRHPALLEEGHAYTLVLARAGNGRLELIVIDDSARPDE